MKRQLPSSIDIQMIPHRKAKETRCYNKYLYLHLALVHNCDRSICEWEDGRARMTILELKLKDAIVCHNSAPTLVVMEGIRL